MPEETPPAPTLQSFEEALKDLEKIVQQLDGGEIPLEQSIQLFEKGMELADCCRRQLEQAETRVEILMKKNGRFQALPFDAGAE